MNPDHLNRTADCLHQPAAEAAAEFEAHREGLAEELSRRMEARSDLEKLIGAGNLPMMQDNSRNLCRFMSTLFRNYEPQVLVETALWVFRAYRAHGFNTTYWPANLDTLVQLLRERLSTAAFRETYPFFEWLIVSIPALVKLTDPPCAPSPASNPGLARPDCSPTQP